MFSRFVMLVFLFCCNVGSHAQDISGTWVGNYQKTLLSANPEKLVVEIFIHGDSLVTGASHLYYSNKNYEHYKIKGVFHKKDSTISFTEDSTSAVKLGFGVTACLGKYTMKLSHTDSSLRLAGRWKDKSTSLFHCPSTGVWLSKKLNKASVPKKTIKHDAADKNLDRTSDIQSLIEVSTAEKDSIKIEVYDNGDIDNDSVSVYFNDRIYIQKQMISTKPLTLYVSLDKQNPIGKIKLAAESLGKYPPCTALMVVTTKKKRYEVKLASNFSANAMVELFLKE